MLEKCEDLPDLPRQLNKREAKKTTDIVKWVRDNLPTGIVEVKQTRTQTLHANALKPHQYANLTRANHTYKPSDATRTRQLADIINIKGGQNFLIIIYGDNTHVLIPAKKIPDPTKKIPLSLAVSLGTVFTL